MDEALLALEHRASLLGAVLGDPHRINAPARVPDHGQKHGRHERDLEQLAPQLDARERVEHDRRARKDDHEAQNDERRPERPHAEAVEQREADPHEMERDRLPARPRDHRPVVDESEQHPQQLHSVTTQGRGSAERPDARAPEGDVGLRPPRDSRHCARSRSGRPVPAAGAVASRTRRRHSTSDRSRSPRPPKAAARG